MATVSELILQLQATPNMDAEVRIRDAALLVAAGDFTGGGSEDLFTLTAHGLVDGDVVQLVYESASGVVTGAVGDTFIVNQLSSSTFQLTTDGSTVVENTADGTAIFVCIDNVQADLSNATDATFAPDAPGAGGDDDPGWVEIG